jgi:hypothetical protein
MHEKSRSKASDAVATLDDQRATEFRALDFDLAIRPFYHRIRQSRLDLQSDL